MCFRHFHYSCRKQIFCSSEHTGGLRVKIFLGKWEYNVVDQQLSGRWLRLNALSTKIFSK